MTVSNNVEMFLSGIGANFVYFQQWARLAEHATWSQVCVAHPE